MAPRKRTNFQREHDLLIIAERYKAGVIQSEIAKELGLSQGQISQDLALVLHRWQTATIETIDDARQREISKLNILEDEYRRAWELSWRDATGVTVETKTAGLQVEAGTDNAVERPVVETKTVKRRARQFGSTAYLDGIRSCIVERSKLKGLYPATKSELTGKDGKPIEVEQRAKPDLSKLGVDELLQLRQIMTKATDGTTDAG